jgi:hypothetical protein
VKPITTLVIVLAAFLAGLALVFAAPSYIDEPARVLLGLGYAGALALALRGPLGQALGDQLRGGSSGHESRVLSQLDEVTAELQAVRDELALLNERMDFTERLLTQQQQEPRHLGSAIPDSRE